MPSAAGSFSSCCVSTKPHTSPAPLSVFAPSTMLSIVIPPQFSRLPSDSMASLASAVASSIWHSVPGQPLQQLEWAHARGKPLFPTSSHAVAVQSPTPPLPVTELVSPLLPHGSRSSAVLGPWSSSCDHPVSHGPCFSNDASQCSHLVDLPESAFATGSQVVRTMLAATQLSPSVILVATLYVARLRSLIRHAVQAAGSELRVLTVALILAAKWMEDHTYANSSWALVSGMSTRDLATMEFEFLSLLQWDLSVSTAQFAAWLSTLTTAATLVFSPTLSPVSRSPTSVAATTSSSGVCRPTMAPCGFDAEARSLSSKVVLPGAFNTSPPVLDSDLALAPTTSMSTAATTSKRSRPTPTPATASKRPRTSSSKSMRLRKASSVVMQGLAASQSHLFHAAQTTAIMMAAQYPTPAPVLPMELFACSQLQHAVLGVPTPIVFSDPFPTGMAASASASVARARYHPYHKASAVQVDAAGYGERSWIAAQPYTVTGVMVQQQPQPTGWIATPQY